jgi:gamma-glutamylaminecyclotransferase
MRANCDADAMENEMRLIFVYGTLKRGHGNHEVILKNSQFVSCATSVGRYTMADGPFPILFDADDEDGFPVRGEVFEVSDMTLAKCDSLEGHPDWYCRHLRPFVLDDGSQVKAWVYIMRGCASTDLVEPVSGVLSWARKI